MPLPPSILVGGKGKPKNVLPRGEARTGRRALPRGVGPSRGGRIGSFNHAKTTGSNTKKLARVSNHGARARARARCLPRSVPRGLPSPPLPHLSATMAFLTRQMLVLASPIVSCGTKARRHAGTQARRAQGTIQQRVGPELAASTVGPSFRERRVGRGREPGRGATSDGRHGSRYIHAVLEVA